MFICLSSAFISDETELHVLLDVGCVVFLSGMCGTVGENWYFRLGELVSPKRECQKLAQGSALSTRPGEGLRSERQVSSLR